MSSDQIVALLQSNMATVLSGAAAFFGLLAFLMAWRGLARAGRLRKDLEQLSGSVKALEAAERRMSLALGKDASSKSAASGGSSNEATPYRPTPAAQTDGPRVDTFGPGEGQPNMFSTQQGISDLSRYRKKS
ncbi:MAG: hypothetical protein AAF292_15600 [Pseudomonadota bacterium]